ncbi:unnamed protein product [Clonostachys rosea f. rosea IK726]|uniref:Uncharacterized protein n=2 Tax=Bionectria ochroleuca TaxID=29856 RepID=A0A0B7JIJ4_BIOOC|nr:unnamed protein product [Clonostachys rosea f. rosea IK726]
MSAPDSNDTGGNSSVARPPLVPGSDSEPEIVHSFDESKPTESHALAEDAQTGEVDQKGSCQFNHNDTEVKNLGWNDDVDKIPQPLVGGIENENLWTLIRRFNKQIFVVKSIDQPPLANLDLNIADEEEFSPEKLRAQLERLYMVVILSLLGGWKHVVRLRSWKEHQRTSAFLAVYSVAWLLDLLMPVTFLFLITLVLSPESREFCFPPAPIALIDEATGGLKKPPAGVLGSDDTFTGAPEKHRGEAVEQEAHSFVNSISSLVVSTAAGKHPQGDPHEGDSAPDPTELTMEVTHAKDAGEGEVPTHEHDRTKAPVSHAVWDRARPLMHAVADVVDTWERFGNALNPTVPFPKNRTRLRLAACLVPLLLGSFLTTSYMLVKGIGFAVGFGFFGSPITEPTLAYLNTNYPRWQEHLQLRHSILRGVPTNAQLTITLLRVGEKNHAPIPPPPRSDIPPPVKPHETAGENLDHLVSEGATDEEIQEAIHPDEEVLQEKHEPGVSKPKTARRILNLIKGTAKGGVETALAADKAKATAGARQARNRLGVVRKSKEIPARGPVSFPARFKGKKGHVYVTTKATTPAVSWTSDLGDMNPAWTVAIGDVLELRKVGGLGWKSKLIVGWALGSEVVDGIIVKTRGGDELHLTAISTRDDLFNRLISMGGQMWEVW